MLQSAATFARRLLRWYDRSRRDLPWRVNPATGGQLDPYHVLVSETMLQQTQVATVIPYYHRFLARFPTLAVLAAADEQDVLRLWQGLGYYSRARNLQAAARAVVRDYAGRLPEDAERLLRLPGVGRYTAGAIASIAFERRAPIVDANVARVLCRIENIDADPREKATAELLWECAARILPRRRVGDFNSALMELGGAGVYAAVTALPDLSGAAALCGAGRGHAGAHTRPPPFEAATTPAPPDLLHPSRRSVAHRAAARKGRWAGMWQFITVDADAPDPPSLPVRIGPARTLGRVAHSLTHRRYEFDVYVAEAQADATQADRSVKWVALSDFAPYPLPRPHVLIAKMLEDERA